MSTKVKTDLSRSCVKDNDLKNDELKKNIAAAHAQIRVTDGKIDNMWVELPRTVGKSETDKICKTAAWVRSNYDVLLVIGIGGSYAGAYAGLEMLGATFPVEFVGFSFDAAPIAKFFETYRDKRVCVNIISKSGTTLEPAAAFNLVENFLRGKKADFKKDLIITTDARKGSLREYADANGITSFVVPDKVGGRFSVLSAVGLFPLAVAGIDINQIMQGAAQAYKDLSVGDLDKNEAYKYAAARYLLHTKGKKNVEILASFYQNLGGLGQWWQQLFGESEGKDGKGLFVSPMIFSRDLHSMGQFIQQGKPILIETIINIAQVHTDLNFTDSSIPARSMEQLNRAAYAGTVKAHADAGVPVIILDLESADAFAFGYLIYFFQIACAMSAYLLGVNPFDQPGVEFYKKNMREKLQDNNITLVIMAAGMGSRYGGIKQIEPVGTHKELIIDYSIYDAVLAGFNKVVFVIRREIEEAFRESIFNRIGKHVKAEYVFQDLYDLPRGFKTPGGRVKPWGTTHAVLAAKNAIDTPFCIINADDFYGREAFVKMAEFLRNVGRDDKSKCSMVGYKLSGTISDAGSVSRGVAEVDKTGMVKEINERLKIEKREGKYGYLDEGDFRELKGSADVAVNFFGFCSGIMPLLEDKFADFLGPNIESPKAEFQVPIALNQLLKEKKITMKMMTVNDKWLGFTYPEDKKTVQDEIKKLVKSGIYPSPLWPSKK